MDDDSFADFSSDDDAKFDDIVNYFSLGLPKIPERLTDSSGESEVSEVDSPSLKSREQISDNAEDDSDVDNVLIQGNVGAADFLPYQSLGSRLKALDELDHEKPEGSRQQPVKRYGDLLADLAEKRKSAPKKVKVIPKKHRKQKIDKPRKVAKKEKRTSQKKPKKTKKTEVKTEPKQKVARHVFEKTEDGKYKCPVCPKAYSGAWTVREHFQKHLNNTLQICGICGVGYAKQHSCDTNQEYRCPSCPKICKSAFSLRFHETIHSSETNYVCKICDASFLNSYRLAKHSMMHKEKRYKCPVCDRGFVSNQLLRVHCRTHTSEKPYECDICSKKFSQRGNRDVHRRVHTQVHPYICDTCDDSFAYKSTFDAHVRTHTKERPFSCDECGKKFSNRGSLHHHKATHRKPSYKCDDCGTEYRHPHALKSHQKKIHGMQVSFRK